MKIEQLKTNIKNKKKWISYGMITLSAILFTIGIQGFLQVAKTFSAGLTAFAALPTFIWTDLNDYVSLLYLAFNAPLMFFFWNKNGKKFMLRTAYFLILQTGIGCLFFVPELKHAFANLINASREDEWPILVLSIIGGVLVGFSISIAWKYGGSTGGTDIITYYFSTKKQKSVGSVLFIVSIAIVTFSFVVTVSVNPPALNIRKFWLISIMSTIFYILITSTIIDRVYPKYKKVRFMVISDKIDEINKKLHEVKYWHSWKIEEFTSGYTGKAKKKIVTVIFLLEEKELMNLVRSVDPNAWVSVMEIKHLHGNLSNEKIDQNNIDT